MANLVLDWELFGALGTDLSGGATVNTGGILATVTYTDQNANPGSLTTTDEELYVAGGESFDTDSGLRIYGQGGEFGGTGSGGTGSGGTGSGGSGVDDTSTTTIDFAAASGSGFADEVQNVSFRINDLDVGVPADDHIDIVTVRAYDAAGNEVPVTFDVPPQIAVSGNTLTGNDAHYQSNDAEASAKVSIAGPVARIVLDYDNGAGTDQKIVVSDINFTTMPASGPNYIVEGTAGDDVIDIAYTGDPQGDMVDHNDNAAGNNDDVIDAGAGDDRIKAGEGNDTIHAGDGNDYASGDAGDDTIYLGAGDDKGSGDDGNDTIYGGAGNDEINGGAGNDALHGEAGNDRINGGAGDDAITGGAGDDRIHGGAGNDVIDAGDGNDYASGDDGDDTIYLGAGDDKGSGDAGDDTIYGGEGADVIHGGKDADTLFGNDDGDTGDQIDGGSDRDTIYGGANDHVDGGSGGDDYDTLYVSNVDHIDYTSGSGEDGIVYFNDGGTLTFEDIENIVPICFTPGTLIATPMGEVPIQTLEVGDRVITRDNGVQEIRWIGSRRLGGRKLAKEPHLRPILIRKNSLGRGLPERDMLVSPNHRMLVCNDRTSLLFHEPEVLVAAKHLVNNNGIHQVDAISVEYIHILFDAHEVVLANGAWSESFQPGDYSLAGIGNSQRAEIFELFPELRKRPAGEVFAPARVSLKRHEADLLKL